MIEASQHDLLWGDRRDSNNRRLRPTRSLHRNGITGRRAELRRKTDIELGATDQFERSIGVVALLIILFNVIDYAFTVYIIEAGGSEVNILMDYAVEQGRVFFFVTKYALTALAVFVLVAYHEHEFFRAIRVRTILYSLVVAYLCLFMHELHLFSLI